MNAARQASEKAEARRKMFRIHLTKRTEFTALVLLAAFVYFGMNFELLTYVAGNIDGRSALKTIALASYLVLGFVGIMFGLAGLPEIIYRAALVIVFVSFSANIALLLISKHVVTGPAVVWLMAESDNTWNAFQEFWKEISVSHTIVLRGSLPYRFRAKAPIWSTCRVRGAADTQQAQRCSHVCILVSSRGGGAVATKQSTC